MNRNRARTVLTLAWLATLPVAHAQRGEPDARCAGHGSSEWSVTIADADEPGEPLEIEGRVLQADGTPAEGVTVYVYHTDREGYYSRGGSAEDLPRLCALVHPGDGGRYRLRTIRPAAYPSASVPQHVHYEVRHPDGARERFELRFADDPKLSERTRTRARETDDLAASVRPVERADDGTWRVVRDLRLDR